MEEIQMNDVKALYNVQSSLKVLQKLMDDKTNLYRDELADVYNAFLDARGSIIQKILDDECMSFAGFEKDLQMILSQRQAAKSKEKKHNTSTTTHD